MDYLSLPSDIPNDDSGFLSNNTTSVLRFGRNTDDLDVPLVQHLDSRPDIGIMMFDTTQEDQQIAIEPTLRTTEPIAAKSTHISAAIVVLNSIESRTIAASARRVRKPRESVAHIFMVSRVDKLGNLRGKTKLFGSGIIRREGQGN
jgi:hypothetical protein